MQQRRQRIEDKLRDRLNYPDNSTSNQLMEAMRYSTLNGGKYLRPLLVYATGETLDADLDLLDPPACAIEMIHTYSLVHDDMPIMDNDELRRGRPTCHKAYNEATALLVGDALQSLAFETLCDSALTPFQQSQMVKTLAQHSGLAGMVGGQAIDLESVGKKLQLNTLQTMHELKTGALIRAGVHMGVLASTKADNKTVARLDHYAYCIGLAFQVQDDILDIITDTSTLGKNQGADITLNKPTYPALIGLEAAKIKASNLVKQALVQLEEIPQNTQTLSELANFVVQRSH